MGSPERWPVLARHGGVGQPDAENFAAAKHRLLFIPQHNDRGRHIAPESPLPPLSLAGTAAGEYCCRAFYHLCTTVELQFIEGISFTEGHAVDIKILRTDPIRAGSNINIVGAQAQVLKPPAWRSAPTAASGSPANRRTSAPADVRDRHLKSLPG